MIMISGLCERPTTTVVC